MRTKNMILGSMFGALTAVGAILAIPLPTPVPFTMQVFFVVLSGILLGPRWGAASQGVYLLMGAIGLPVFSAGTSGLVKLVGPTGGYLLSYIVAAYVVGWITKGKPNKFIWTMLSSLVGLVVIYLVGATQLALVTGMTAQKAFAAGVAPFIIFDLAKITAAAVIGVAAKKALVKANLLTEAA